MKLLMLFFICLLPVMAEARILRDTLPGEVITVPVVIHLLYNNVGENISTAQILSQLEVLNRDYRKNNNDRINTPLAFAGLAADARITFCLARVDPKGRPTSGIIRKFTNEKAWVADDAVKSSAKGGNDAWDAKRYLNIWVCNLFGRNLGYSSLPGSTIDKDGVVIQYDVFGATGNVRAPFDKGRTLTHEIGHWLGLKHMWGDDDCGDDGIADTPPQRSYHTGCPAFPQMSTCSLNANGDMYMNFMDFTDDGCMNMFTKGQVKKIRSVFATGGDRNSFLISNVCDSAQASGAPSGDPPGPVGISVYPNPLVNMVTLEATDNAYLAGRSAMIVNPQGRVVKTFDLNAGKNKFDLSDLPAGIYFMRLVIGTEMKTMKIVKL